MAGWVLQRETDYIPQSNVSERSRFTVEFCALPGLGDVSGVVAGLLNVLPSAVRFQLAKFKLEQDSSGPGCVNLFGLADRYRLTLLFAGTGPPARKG